MTKITLIGLSIITASTMLLANPSNETANTNIQAQQEAMMAAMFPRIKEKFLSGKEALLFGKECFNDAKTNEDAESCGKKMDTMLGETSEPDDTEEGLGEWNEETKKEVLGFIDQGLAGIECAAKASNMQEIQACMPAE